MMIKRIAVRGFTLLASCFLAVRAKLVPSALDRAVKTFTAAEGLLDRAEAAANKRIETERAFRMSLMASRDASFDRSSAARADANRAARIRTRLSDLLD